MTTILNPIIKDGSTKVKCIHHYEWTPTSKTKMFSCIFEYNGHMYFYKVEDYDKQNSKRTLIDCGETEPLTATKAVNYLKKSIK